MVCFLVRVLANHSEEGIDVQPFLLCGRDERFQFSLAALQLLLLSLIGLRHPGIPLIADLTLHIVLVKPLHNHIQLSDTGLGLCQFTIAVTKLTVQFLLALPGDQLYEIILMLTGVGSDEPQFPEKNFLDLYIVDLMRGAYSLDFPVCGTYEILLLVGPPSGSDLIQFCPTVSTEQHPGQDRHFAPVLEWWNNRQPISVDGFDKAKCFSYQEMTEVLGYNLDQCGYPHEEEEILDPLDLIQRYEEERASLNAEIDRVLEEITARLGGQRE